MLSIRYTECLSERAIEPLMRSIGDLFDNALAEPIIGLYTIQIFAHDGRGEIRRR